jgi:hypothetical protein
MHHIDLFGEKAMDNMQCSYMIDSLLDAILRDSGHWSINGQA